MGAVSAWILVVGAGGVAYTITESLRLGQEVAKTLYNNSNTSLAGSEAVNVNY
jgi:hypothetical protein